MKKTSLIIAKTVSEMALAYTKINVNSFCIHRLYQPKMPKGFEKLK